MLNPGVDEGEVPGPGIFLLWQVTFKGQRLASYGHKSSVSVPFIWNKMELSDDVAVPAILGFESDVVTYFAFRYLAQGFFVKNEAAGIS